MISFPPRSRAVEKIGIRPLQQKGGCYAMLLAFKKCEGGKMRWGIEVAHEVEEWVGEKRPRDGDC